MEGLEPSTDTSEGAWLADRLPGLLGTVASVVPRGFDAYARILHPVEMSAGGQPLTWVAVCERTGRIPHARMQWTAIAGGLDDGDGRVGSLAPPALSALLGVLAPVTGGQDCFHALWEGWGWVDGSGVLAVSVCDDGRVEPAPQPPPGVLPEVWELPRLRLPGRDYLLFRGPLRAAANMGWHAGPGDFQPQSPSLLWPADRSWCVGTEIDFDSTLVGGSAGLIGAVLAASGLEAWPVEPDDDLTIFGDALNSRRGGDPAPS